MKILFVTKHYQGGAGDRSYMFRLEKLLRHRGHDVGYFAMHYPQNRPTPFSKYFVSNITFNDTLHSRHPGHWAKALLSSFYSLESRVKIGQLLEDYRPDMVHIHSLDAHLTYSILPAIKKRSIPIVWTLHSFSPLCINYFLYDRKKGRICEACKPDRYYMAALKRCKNGSLAASMTGALINGFNRLMPFLKLVDAFICPSRFLRNKFIEFNFRPEKLFVVPNFVNLPAPATRTEESYGIFVGRIEPEKGVRVVAEALKNTPIPFKFIGDGSARKELIGKTAQMGLHQVEFTGFKSGDELKNLFAGALFSVVPSLIYDVAPLTILESYAFAKPVIGFNIGGIPELIKHNETGLIVEDLSAERLREKMLSLYHNPATAARMGDRARRYVQSAHDAEQHYRRMMAVYSACRGGKSDVPPPKRRF